MKHFKLNADHFSQTYCHGGIIMLGWELQTHYRNWLGKCKGAERSPRPALLCWEVFGVHYWGSCSAKETIIVYAFLRDGFACWKKIRSLWAAGRGSQMDLVSWGGERRSVWSLLSKRRRILLCHRWEPHCAAPAADPPQHTRHVTLTHGLHISHIYVWVYFYFLTSFLTFTVHAFHFLFFFVHCKAPKHQGTFLICGNLILVSDLRKWAGQKYSDLLI